MNIRFSAVVITLNLLNGSLGWGDTASAPKGRYNLAITKGTGVIYRDGTRLPSCPAHVTALDGTLATKIIVQWDGVALVNGDKWETPGISVGAEVALKPNESERIVTLHFQATDSVARGKLNIEVDRPELRCGSVYIYRGAFAPK